MRLKQTSGIKGPGEKERKGRRPRTPSSGDDNIHMVLNLLFKLPFAVPYGGRLCKRFLSFTQCCSLTKIFLRNAPCGVWISPWTICCPGFPTNILHAPQMLLPWGFGENAEVQLLIYCISGCCYSGIGVDFCYKRHRLTQMSSANCMDRSISEAVGPCNPEDLRYFLALTLAIEPSYAIAATQTATPNCTQRKDDGRSAPPAETMQASLLTFFSDILQSLSHNLFTS